ncbi:hypothetical protein [Mycobacteroides immunogenum]|uniref:Uncharacterized protein n=1 Tax=Mycobacteroides immunogenum TaxID=83262 RepID=A0A7V8LSQ6_9MYCO|nr:hypothetical protein [Mycobacteroides immunogenum]AMT71397.1 hypothetical protein ABG82_14815 [Mycobacteroides immunogenum]ANO04508.1 hypothetical protein BAB75_15045 [Mycobacteroides immunogenum]KIU42413.1 hypothetical protein TL11_01085 [Mycobacteroides immunogenum]KPG15002.1 hypothetical protein AN909_01070 [Mycobacteroides immunogenum]KPG15618.1 hypothetical protein AN910_06220 [Mycobacteroides immunogenum]
MKLRVGSLAVALVTMSGIAISPAIGSADPETPSPAPASETDSRTAILPVFAAEGIRVRTGNPGELLTIQLPGDVPLAPAQWGPDGEATYRSADTDYTITPLIDGGEYFTIVKKSPADSFEYNLRLGLPAGTHWVRHGTTLLIESDGAPDKPSMLVGMFASPKVTNGKGTDVPLTVEIDADGAVTFSARNPELAKTPVEIGFSYHPVDATP